MPRLDEEFERRWHQEAEAGMSGMREWHVQHPKATFREIEAAVDEKLSGMRARLLEDLAMASRAAGVMDGADWEQTFLDVHPADAARILDYRTRWST